MFCALHPYQCRAEDEILYKGRKLTNLINNNMISELKTKLNDLNKIVGSYQRGEYSEEQFKDAIAKGMDRAFGRKSSEENPCEKPHNNGRESCVECEVIKSNV